MRTLIARHGAKAIALDRVALGDIRELLGRRFPSHAFPDDLCVTVDGITAGTPLFVVAVLDDLVARDMLVQRDGGWQLTATLDEVRSHRPESVKQLIDIRLDRLESAEQRVLEAAAIIGQEFSCRLIAAALELDVETVDETCDGLARRGLFLRREPTETWPDGTQHTRYAVTHGLVQEVCLARSAPARQQRWHRQVAEHLEAAYPDRTEIALVLATHFERGQLPVRAVDHYLVAADRTATRFATRDALVLYRRGLSLLPRTPAGPHRDAVELRLLGGVVASTLRTSDPASTEPGEQLTRMIALARGLGDADRLVAALLNLAFRYQLISDHRRGAEIFEEVERVIAGASLHPALTGFAGAMRALNWMWLGKLDGVAEVFEAQLAARDLEEPSLGILGPTDRRTVLAVYLSHVRWLTGDRDRAFADADHALELARATKDPFGLGFALCGLAWLHAVSGGSLDAIASITQSVLDMPDTTVWQPTAQLLHDCATATDPDAADQIATRFLGVIPTIPLGVTRLGLVVASTLQRTDHLARARELTDRLLAFVEHHEERVVEPQLRALRDQLTSSGSGT